MKKKKISILTFAKGDNYGAVLQAYGLATTLRRMGYDIEFIHFTWTTLVHEILSSITPLKYRFEYFRRKYLKSFSKKCHTPDDLTKAIENSDICIVGSDQVWNPDITTSRAKYYFFDFVPDSISCIAYAASFGVDQWKWPELQDDVKGLLDRFKYVSVREASGIKICKDVFNVKARQVLDPTLLLGEFNDMLLKTKKRNYVLGFKFVTSPEYYAILEHVAKKLNSKPLVMDLFPRDLKYTLRVSASYFSSPERWVTNIAYSQFVITDSFHCMVFAILFKRDFLVIPSSRLKSVQGRMSSLLDLLGLSDRIFPTIEDAYNSSIWSIPIDYNKVEAKLSVLRKESISFLEEALS